MNKGPEKNNFMFPQQTIRNGQLWHFTHRHADDDMSGVVAQEEQPKEKFFIWPAFVQAILQDFQAFRC